jgi:hypothetical protein
MELADITYLFAFYHSWNCPLWPFHSTKSSRRKRVVLAFIREFREVMGGRQNEGYFDNFVEIGTPSVNSLGTAPSGRFLSDPQQRRTVTWLRLVLELMEPVVESLPGH